MGSLHPSSLSHRVRALVSLLGGQAALRTDHLAGAVARQPQEHRREDELFPVQTGSDQEHGCCLIPPGGPRNADTGVSAPVLHTKSWSSCRVDSCTNEHQRATPNKNGAVCKKEPEQVDQNLRNSTQGWRRKRHASPVQPSILGRGSPRLKTRG